MKTISTYQINYVVCETEAEEREIQKIISDVKKEKFGIDFSGNDLTLLKAKGKSEKGYYTRES